MKTQYKEIVRGDLITKLEPLFANGRFFLRDDGKITQTTRLTHDSPWIHHKTAPNRNCGLYHVYHEYFKFVHSRCQECWKVVVRPRTLLELYKLMELQKALDLPCKCGIEKRGTVFGLYGGYFYNDSKELGLECYKLVRANVDANLSPDVIVILKRGCTEFEIGGHGGPSDKWEVSKDQTEMEAILNDLVYQDVVKLPQPDHVKEAIFRSWIHYAYANGDVTYKEFTGGEPLFPAYVTYHEEVENDGKEK